MGKPAAAAKGEEVPAGGEKEEGLMELMKNLYQNGNDEIKKTISEAWSKSNDKKNMLDK